MPKGNSAKEVKIKHELYQDSGSVNIGGCTLNEQVIYAFLLNTATERYELSNSFSGDDSASPSLFPELAIDLQKLFTED